MGYSHYWSYDPSNPAYAMAWPTIIDNSRRIVERLRRAGIVIAGPDGRRSPILDLAAGIRLNGDATTDLDGEPFQLLAPPASQTGGDGLVDGVCKTNRRPYDVVVAAVLLRCHLLLPGHFRIDSDGNWDDEWRGGATPRVFAGLHEPSGARGVIAELFDVRPTESPLRRRRR